MKRWYSFVYFYISMFSITLYPFDYKLNQFITIHPFMNDMCLNVTFYILTMPKNRSKVSRKSWIVLMNEWFVLSWNLWLATYLFETNEQSLSCGVEIVTSKFSQAQIDSYHTRNIFNFMGKKANLIVNSLRIWNSILEAENNIYLAFFLSAFFKFLCLGKRVQI